MDTNQPKVKKERRKHSKVKSQCQDHAREWRMKMRSKKQKMNDNKKKEKKNNE